ncbi:Uncharacterised protein [Leclercia adecarboxylata]|uniref:Uncharacterized protein n=1 Tax=Leclercia adecarboxylata TaxID=83655 RepID=A0A4U9HVE7_9ENTR|nr:Uncharacterised protein [Leclercia adecarboxylata]
MGKERVVLKDGVDVALPGREFAGIFAKDSDGAAAKLFKARNQAQAGGFAGAGRPSIEKNSPSRIRIVTPSTHARRHTDVRHH